MSDTEHPAAPIDEPPESAETLKESAGKIDEANANDPGKAPYTAPIQGAPATADKPVIPNAADPALNPYPPGHPNLPPVASGAPGTIGAVPHEHSSAVVGTGALPGGVKGLYDARTSPVFGAPPSTPDAVTGMQSPVTAAEMAAYERVRIGAHEFANVLKQFAYQADPSTDIGKMVAFFRDEFGIKQG